MELNNYRKNFRRVSVKLFYLDESGNEKEDTLDVRYKPITQQWLDENELAQKHLAKLIQEGASLAEEVDALVATAKELADKAELDDSKQTESDEATKAAEDAKARLEAFLSERKMEGRRQFAESLASVLIDLDIVDNGKPVQPTVNFLMDCDVEFLADINESIRKKTFRYRMSG